MRLKKSVSPGSGLLCLRTFWRCEIFVYWTVCVCAVFPMPLYNEDWLQHFLTIMNFVAASISRDNDIGSWDQRDFDGHRFSSDYVLRFKHRKVGNWQCWQCSTFDLCLNRGRHTWRRFARWFDRAFATDAFPVATVLICPTLRTALSIITERLKTDRDPNPVTCIQEVGAI